MYLGSAIDTLSDLLKRRLKAGLLMRKNQQIAQGQQRAVYFAFIKGLLSQWIYILRIVLDVAKLLQPLEDVIRFVLILALTG